MERPQVQPNDETVGVGKTLGSVASLVSLLVFLSLYWGISGFVLWWSYDLNPLIRGGYYERHQALALVAKMGFIVTTLTSIVWVVMRRRRVNGPPWRLIWKVAWRTLLILVMYASVILLRVQFSSEPATDAKFFGAVNAQFFSETGSLSFLLNVVPIMGCVSGVLYWLQVWMLGGFRHTV